MRCASCGQENPEGFRFCGSCGAMLVEPPPARELRKVVTVVFCDLTGSTALGDATDPEPLRATMRAFYEQMRAILERHGGTVEKFIGDAVMAVFGVPVAHEDDALRAVRSAWEMQAAVASLDLRARIGVNTGEVVAGEGDALVTGDAVNVAARLEQAAEAGEVLIGPETRHLVRDAVRVEAVDVIAKGKLEPLSAFRLIDVDPEAAPIARQFDTPLVGRRSELEQLVGAFERIVRERRCHLFTLLGVAGVGKSRLVRELEQGLDATVLHGRCLDYGEGITFWPVVSVLKQLGERADGTLARLVEGASTPNELFWAVRTQLEEVASERPLVVCFDDVQWGEDTFLDLIDHVADLSRGAPLFLLCLARPELLEKRPGWGGGKLNATTILLEPLSADECLELIDAHGGAEATTRERILATAEGNPLFVEEMISFAREAGDVRVPGTVQALLQARLDQLGREERSVIEHGAVEGQVFHRGAVVELARATDLDPQLAGLVRKELIHPAVATFADDRAFRFRHLLIRDAAYDALPKETRAELHERFAAWLARHGTELIELDEVLGYHLEQAARYRRELGQTSADLEQRAGRALAAAGSRAAARSDVSGALNLLGRATALLPEDDDRRGQALLDQVLVLESARRVEDRLALIDMLEAADDERLRMHGRLARLMYRLHAEPEQAAPDAELASAEALTLFEATGDDIGAARAYQVAALAHWLRSQSAPTVAALDGALSHARGRDAAGLRAVAALMMTGPLRYGPLGPDEVRRHITAIAQLDSVMARFTVWAGEASLASRAGRTDEALGFVRQCSSLAGELGLTFLHITARWTEAVVLFEGGRIDEAIACCRWVVDELERSGFTSFRSTALLDLAAMHYARGEIDQAERLAVEGENIGAAEDLINYAYGEALRARIASDRGAHDDGESLARRALEYAYRTDFPGAQAKAHEALGHVLAGAGRREQADEERRRARALWDRYGFVVEAARVTALLDAAP